MLWTMVSERITRTIVDLIRQCSDLQSLDEINQATAFFVPALEVGYCVNACMQL